MLCTIDDIGVLTKQCIGVNYFAVGLNLFQSQKQ